MQLGFGISQEQTQKLLMTPELRLAIKILQFSAIELAQFVEEQLIENPVLDVEEEATEKESEPSLNDESTDAGVKDTETNDWEHYFDGSRGADNPRPIDYQGKAGRFDQFVAQAPTLQEYLMFQLTMSKLNAKQKLVGEFLVGSIDDNGYLKCSVDEAAIHCNMPFDAAEKMLKIIQGFDPPGIGARDLRECLMIQYEQLGLQNDLLKKIISNHLEEVGAGKFMKVAKKLGIPLELAQKAIDGLRHLEPKPGRRFSSEDGTRYIVPDILVEKVGGEYVILVNDVSAPRLFISPTYRNMMRDILADREGRKYLESKLHSAVWLVKSIEQRRLTLYKVARCIVDFQMDFLERGIKFLKPMNLKHVADSLGIHESTVSRATANKYMQTPRGVFEMKFFFSSGVSNEDGNSTSAEAIKKMIKELVEGENPLKPLSDEKITNILREEGIEISRRTVAKYRDEVGIVATSRRRRY